MSYETVLVEKNEHIGVIILNRPDELNTFTSTTARELNEALVELEQDQDTRVVIIKSAGKAFCAGIDVNEMSGKNTYEQYKWVEVMERPFLTMANMLKPVIASVQDMAIANGVGIVASADLAIAAETARFGTTAINVGLFCMGPAVPLARHMSKKKALEMLLTGDIIDGKEAEKLGLINKAVPLEKVDEETMKLAKKLAAKSPLALQLGKQSFYQMWDLDYASAFELVNNHFAVLCSTDDGHEGVNAFLEKRDPNWKMK